MKLKNGLKRNTVAIEVPVLTKAMIEAGIVRVISEQQTNGSYICLVNLSNIQKDENINPRKISDGHVADILADWSLDCFDSPKVNCKLPNGKALLAHINGQHSIKAAIKQGLSQATCQVWFNKSDEECAHIFYQAASNTKRMNTWDSYKSALLSGDKTAQQISNACGQFNFSTQADAGPTADLKNYAPIYEAATKYNNRPGMLDRFLDVLDLFKDENNQLTGVASKGEFQRGLLDFIAANWDKSLKTIKTRLDRKDALYYHNLASETSSRAHSRANRGYFKQAFASVFGKNSK
jgi:hypothetical protein